MLPMSTVKTQITSTSSHHFTPTFQHTVLPSLLPSKHKVRARSKQQHGLHSTRKVLVRRIKPPSELSAARCRLVLPPQQTARLPEINKKKRLQRAHKRNKSFLLTSTARQPFKKRDSAAKSGKTRQTRVLRGLVRKCCEGTVTLPFLMYNFSHEMISAVLAHPRITSNSGWFHQFLNSQDKAGNGALHIAVFNNEGYLCNELLRHNILVNVLNQNRATPLDLALFEKHYEIAELLLRHGAKMGPLLYENREYYQQQVTTRFKKLLHKYGVEIPHHTKEGKHKKRKDMVVPPIHVYEKPLAFAGMQHTMADERVSDHFIDVASARSTRSRSSSLMAMGTPARCVMLKADNYGETFFDAFVNFDAFD